MSDGIHLTTRETAKQWKCVNCGQELKHLQLTRVVDEEKKLFEHKECPKPPVKQ